MSPTASSTAPPFFTWVIPDKLAAHGLPDSPQHMQYLWEVGIRHLVSLTAEFQPLLQVVPDMNWIHISIIDWHSPTMEQVEEFLDAVDRANSKKEALSVHCFKGRGRTGTMLACYLVKTKHITAIEAIAQIRKMRPGSLETIEQEETVGRYYLKVKDTW